VTDKRTPLEQFTAAVELAMKLPTPQVISRAILSGTPEVDDGLRAASYDGDRVTGGTSGSHPERMLAVRNPDMFPRDNPEHPESREKAPRTRGNGNRASDDLYRLSKASERIVEAVSSLLAEVLDTGCPDLTEYAWDDAIKDAHLIAEHNNGETFTAAVDLGRHVIKWVDRFTNAVDTVRAIRDSWMAHDPSQGLAESNQAWCRPHLRIDIKRKRVSAVCCQQCWRDIQDLEQLGAPVDLQRDPKNWPSEPMLRAREDGRTALFQKERQAWLRGHGVDLSRVAQRRQERRSA
jgi:hypothetical protein